MRSEWQRLRSQRSPLSPGLGLRAALVLALLGQVPTLQAAPQPGAAAPPLVVTDLKGERLELQRLRGRVVIVNVWATWCPPCVAEMPLLDAFYRAHHDEGVELVGLSADRHADHAAVVRAMQAFSYPAALLSEASANGWGTPQAVPLTYVIDTAGVVRTVLVPGKNAVSEASLLEAVRPLLSSATQRAASPVNGSGPP